MSDTIRQWAILCAVTIPILIVLHYVVGIFGQLKG